MTRRRLLAGSSVAVVGSLAGCVGDDGGTPAGTPTEEDVQMVEDLGTLELRFGSEGVSPEAVRVEAEVRVTVLVRNEGEESHAVVQPESDFGPVSVEPGDVERALWNVPAEPGTYRFRCRYHAAALTRVEVLPGGVSGGCPSG